MRPAPPSQPAHLPTQSSAPTGAAALAAARAAAASRAADDKTSAYRKAMEAAAALVAPPSRKQVSEAFSALPPPPPCLLPPPPSFRFSGQTAGGGEGVGDGGADPAEVAEGGSKRRVGDWDCPGCGAMVWATKDQCFRCRAAKPKDAGDTSPIDLHTLFWETLHADLDVNRRGGEHGRCDESGGGLRRSRCLSQAQGQS